MAYSSLIQLIIDIFSICVLAFHPCFHPSFPFFVLIVRYETSCVYRDRIIVVSCLSFFLSFFIPLICFYFDLQSSMFSFIIYFPSLQCRTGKCFHMDIYGQGPHTDAIKSHASKHELPVRSYQLFLSLFLPSSLLPFLPVSLMTFILYLNLELKLNYRSQSSTQWNHIPCLSSLPFNHKVFVWLCWVSLLLLLVIYLYSSLFQSSFSLLLKICIILSLCCSIHRQSSTALWTTVYWHSTKCSWIRLLAKCSAPLL